MFQLEEEEKKFLREILKARPYEAISKLSYGSYGEIYLIENPEKKTFVLKIVSKSRMLKEQKLHEAVIEGFMLSKLEHPGIVGYLETIETEEYISQVLEYCPLGDLSKVMKKVSKSIELALKKREIAMFYLSQILETLSYLHSKGIMHRDLKLENVVVAQNLNAKLVDFGTAKPLNPEAFYSDKQVEFISSLRSGNSNEQLAREEEASTRSKSFVGSANYLSPESITMEHSLSTDIWAFGVLAYRLFHDRLPFEGENSFEIFQKIRQYDLKINEKLDKEIQDLIKDCLQVNPKERPTAEQLKKHPYFKGISFQQAFKRKSPIDLVVLRSSEKQASSNSGSKLLFELGVEKKMFFGNFKPRILKMSVRQESLFMGYWYTDGKTPKNEFEIVLGDCAVGLNKKQFQIRNRDVKYMFKVGKEDNAEKVADKLNKIITEHFSNHS